MRIVAGEWRGRTLVAPAGATTRPTADRVRQSLFDMLLHAPWAGRAVIEAATVLDVFAGTGALGLEALSRGAAKATFIERDPAALSCLRDNVAACRAHARSVVLPANALQPPAGAPCRVVFLDPPYALDLIPRAAVALGAAGWIAPGTLIVAELGRDETLPDLGTLLAERHHGAARIAVWQG